MARGNRAVPEPNGDPTEHEESPRRHGSAVGVLMAIGLIVGAVVGGAHYYSPAPGALIGGGVGVVLGLMIDGWRRR